MEIRTVKINQLKPHPKNESIYGKEIEQGFLDNIKQYGVIDRLIVTNDYTILSGHRRWLACQSLGIENVEIEISKLIDPLDQLEYLLNANKQREKDNEMKIREYKIYKEIEEERLRIKLSEIKKGNENASKTTRLNLDELKENIKPERSDVIASDKVGLKKDEARKKELIVDILDEVRKESEDAGKVLKHALENESTDQAFKLAKEVKENKEEALKKLESINEKLESGESKTVKDAIKKENFEKKKAEFEKPIEVKQTLIKVYNKDCIEVMSQGMIKDVDLVLSDVPYGMDFKSGWSDKDRIANDKIEDTISLLDNAFKLMKECMRDNAHIYIFGNPNEIENIKPLFTKYFILSNILIWDRKIIGMGDLSTYGRSYDIIYFGYKKEWKPLNGNRDRDVLSFERVSPNNLLHPTEKPEDLLTYLIKKSTKENDIVLDPFAGSCSTLKACSKLNRIGFGCELEKKYIPLEFSYE